MKSEIQLVLSQLLPEEVDPSLVPEVTISSDPKHGEYTTNIAMRLSKQLKKSPMDIALQVKKNFDNKKSQLTHKDGDHITEQRDQNESEKTRIDFVLRAIDTLEVVAPGFINIFLSEANLSTQLDRVLNEKEAFGTSQVKIPLSVGEGIDPQASRIMVEFAHPNTHKAFHIGHLRNITTGECIVRLLEAGKHEVIRVNYQGDVGMHIAKCLWAMTKLPAYDPASVRGKEIHERVEFLGKAYAAGSTQYEENDGVKAEVGQINKQIYAKDPGIFTLYEETRGWSLEYFDSIYRRVGTHFDRLYFESEFYEKGKSYVSDGVVRGIFEESEGAIIFPGEKFGTHNRVFITKEGNATYEGKEIGLGRAQFDEYAPDLIMHVVGPEQAGYFNVLFQALAKVFPETSGREYHKVYGWVKLKHGKMSSRTGQVVLGEWLLDEAKRSIYEILSQNKSNYTKEEQEDIAEKAAIAAVKYAFLKVTTNQEIAFDLKESVSFDGDSGPYLLYTQARARSVLRKNNDSSTRITKEQMNDDERLLARQISFYPEIVEEAISTLSPNGICTYLFKLAQMFNVFYQKHPIVGNSSRLRLTSATAQVLNNGLYLLGISSVERM